jgi:hypothetical protein
LGHEADHVVDLVGDAGDGFDRTAGVVGATQHDAVLFLQARRGVIVVGVVAREVVDGDDELVADRGARREHSPRSTEGDHLHPPTVVAISTVRWPDQMPNTLRRLVAETA